MAEDRESEIDVVNTSEDEEEVHEEENVDIENDVKYVEGSEIYVVCFYDTPKVYFNTAEEATEKMWEMAKNVSNNYNSSYRTFICNEKNNTLTVSGFSKFFIFSCERVLASFKMYKIGKLET